MEKENFQGTVTARPRGKSSPLEERTFQKKRLSAHQGSKEALAVPLAVKRSKKMELKMDFQDTLRDKKDSQGKGVA